MLAQYASMVLYEASLGAFGKRLPISLFATPSLRTTLLGASQGLFAE